MLKKTEFQEKKEIKTNFAPVVKMSLHLCGDVIVVLNFVSYAWMIIPGVLLVIQLPGPVLIVVN